MNTIIKRPQYIYTNLEDLKQEFDFKWRVQSYSAFKPQAVVVPYCDSRDVQDVLDKVCGAENWQSKYEEVCGNLYCHIGIRISGEWVWKSDCGTESNVEKEKGEASDAFKRAAVKWGVGRFLYSMRPFTLKANKKKEQSDRPSHLWCLDDKDRKLADWQITAYINAKRGSSKPVPSSNYSAKGEEASAELGALERWAKNYDIGSIIDALKLLGLKADAQEYRREGLASLPRVNYSPFCHLVKIAGFDEDLVGMCLEGFGFADLMEVVQEEATEKVFDECKLIHSQAAK